MAIGPAKRAKSGAPQKSAKASFAVGKGRPPAATKFKKGQSGNPKGRPKGSKNLATLIQDAAWDDVLITTKTGEQKKLSRIQATTLQLANQAAKGEPRMVLKFMDWVDEIERRAAEARPSEPTIGEADLEVLRQVYERLKLCEPPKAS